MPGQEQLQLPVMAVSVFMSLTSQVLYCHIRPPQAQTTASTSRLFNSTDGDVKGPLELIATFALLFSLSQVVFV